MHRAHDIAMLLGDLQEGAVPQPDLLTRVGLDQLRNEPDVIEDPQQLAAAAYSSRFSMALALTLGNHDLTPDRLTVTATVTLADADGVPTVASSALKVVGAVPGTDAAGFFQAVDEASQLCRISRLFAGAQISVEASLKASE